ncbi:AMP-binding protein [Kineococcus sp. TBRC 1896]|uniref:AMP-binding protein n=1 Tax=Kineococcus mangrovi TaxID=1660183 RepID=A0ABV4I435_9ACTN
MTTRTGSSAGTLTEAQRGVVHAQLVADDPASFTVGELVHLTVPASAPGLVPADVAAAVAQAVRETGLDAVRVAVDGAVTTGPDRFTGPGTTPVADVAAARAWAALRIARGLPLGPDPLHEQHLLVVGPRHVAWFTGWHHVLVDGWGVGLVVRRVTELLAARRGGTPAPAAWFTPVADVAAAEQEYRASAASARDRAFWVDRAGTEGAARGFGDPAAARSGGPVTVRSGRFEITGPDLDRAAGRFGATWAELALAAHLLVLSRLRGTQDVVLGVPLMNRTGTTGSRAALCPTTVVNVVPLAVRVDPAAAVADLVGGVVDALREVRRHGRFRAEELARATGRLHHDRPLVGTELNLKTFDHPDTAADVAVAVENLGEGPVDDLSVSLTRARDGRLDWRAHAPAGLLRDEQVDAVLTECAALLRGFCGADPRTPVAALAGAAPTGLTTPAVDPVGAVDLLRDTATRFPDRLALVDGGTRWTVTDLVREVAETAGWLDRACPPATPVALDLPRGADAVVAHLACLVAGRTAVPLDTTWPLARRDDLVRRLGPGELRLTPGTVGRRPGTRLTDLPVPAPGTPAHVIHTSGSTGEPKAVLVTHGAFAAFLAHHRATTFAPGRGTPADRGLRVAQTLPLVFDGSWDTLQAVLSGHEVHLLAREVAQDPAATVAAVRAHGLEFVDTTPTVAAALLDAGLLTRPHPVRVLTVGGEACPPALWARLRGEPGLVVRNLYGPTESTVDAVGLEGEDAAVGGTPIGRPVHGTTARVLDTHLRPVPVGFPGELHLAGPQLALGYRGAGALTAARFVADPWGPPGSRMYRTGDLVALRADGLLDYLGRADRQLKVRGYRVEPAEVESALLRLAGVRQAAVVERGGRLLAYVVGPRDTHGAGDALRAAAADVLPEHLVPAAVVVLDALPRTATGKLDPTALPQPTAGAPAPGRPPHGPAETAWARSLADALGLPVADVRAGSDFFALGGDSITAIRAVAAFRGRGFSGSVSTVFTRRTVEAVAAAATPVVAAVPAPAVPQFDAAQISQVQDLLTRRRTGGRRA